MAALLQAFGILCRVCKRQEEKPVPLRLSDYGLSIFSYNLFFEQQLVCKRHPFWPLYCFIIFGFVSYPFLQVLENDIEHRYHKHTQNNTGQHTAQRTCTNRPVTKG